MSINKLQLSRSINLQPIVLKTSIHPTTSTQNLNQDQQQASNLSPAISVNINDFKSLLESKLNLNTNSKTQPSINTPSSPKSTENTHQADLISNKCLKLGDYILFKESSQNDSFSSAFNSKTNRFYYWKVCLYLFQFLTCIIQQITY